jgi:hypothetical protein
VTYTLARVDLRIAGDLPSEVWIRTLGGVVEGIGQRVEGEAFLVPGMATLVFLSPGKAAQSGRFVVTARGQGQFALIKGADGIVRLGESDRSGVWERGPASALARDVLDRRALDSARDEIVARWSTLRVR